MTTFRRLLKWAAILALFIVAGITAAGLAGLYAESESTPWYLSGRWLGWYVHTGIVFTLVAFEYRQNWLQLSFWLAFALIFSVHALLFAVVFNFITVWRSAWFFPISVVEFFAAMTLLGWANATRSDRRSIRLHDNRH